MAETTGTTRKSTPARKAPAAKRTSTARRQTTRTKSSTASKRGAATTANRRTQARARQVERKAETRLDQAQAVAERAVLVQVGAALEARDRVLSTVNGVVELTTKRTAAEKQVKRLEKRGATARTRVEREVKKTRTRVERELRQRRARLERTLKTNERRVERELADARKDVERDGKGLRQNVTANAGLVAAQVENVVQTGLTAGAKIVSGASDRVASVA